MKSSLCLIVSAALLAAVVMCLPALTTAQDSEAAISPAATAPAGAAVADGKFHVWLYWHTGLIADENVTKTIDMIKRMKKGGYTGLALLDNKQHRLDEQTPAYLANVKKVRAACTEQGLDFVATCLPLGYANDMMTADPNLAAGIPVVDAPFIVKDGKIVPDDPVKLINPDFADHKDNKPAGWGLDVPGKGAYVDTKELYNGKPSIRMEDIKANGEFNHIRAFQTIKVKPFQNYHISVAAKTKDFKGTDNRLMALGTTGQHEGRIINVPELTGLKPTSDWAVYHNTFNTQDCEQVAIYVGSWSGNTGTIWFADVKIEPAGLTNMVRRPGAPFKATSLDGKTTYAEGKDLPEMKDPGLGKSPYRGGYQWHEGPKPQLPKTSSLKDGDKLLLSFYQTAFMCYGDQVPMCMGEPKGYEVIEKIVQSIAANAQPDYWFLEHDEIRLAGWCKACEGKTPGQMLADNISKCHAMIKKASPAVKGVFVWSDMFDPHHNAFAKDVGEPYFYVCKGKGPWNKSWEGLPKEMGLINWNSRKPASVKFFSEQGHPQIFSGSDPAVMAEVLKASGSGKGVTGVIYVTWSGDFGPNVEKFAQTALNWKAQQK